MFKAICGSTRRLLGWYGLRLFALSLLSAAACGDVAQEYQGTASCDAAYCVDCADPCCVDLGYC